MLARRPMGVLFAFLITLSPFAITACGDSKPAGSTPTNASGTNPAVLKNYPGKESKAAK